MGWQKGLAHIAIHSFYNSEITWNLGHAYSFSEIKQFDSLPSLLLAHVSKPHQASKLWTALHCNVVKLALLVAESTPGHFTTDIHTHHKRHGQPNF